MRFLLWPVPAPPHEERWTSIQRRLTSCEKYNPDQPAFRRAMGMKVADGEMAAAPVRRRRPEGAAHRPRTNSVGYFPTACWSDAASGAESRTKDLPGWDAGCALWREGRFFNNLPKNTQQILKYRKFVQDDVTGEWHVCMDLPRDSEMRFTRVQRGQDAGKADSGWMLLPRPVAQLCRQKGRAGNQNRDCAMGIRTPIPGPYFKVFNDGGQPISPVTGRTVDKDAPAAHYPVDPVKSWFKNWFGGWFGVRNV